MIRGLSILCAALLLSTSARATDLSHPGPLAVAETQVAVVRPDLSLFPALLFYPAGPDRIGAPYPAICFAHGYLTAPERYAPTLRHLASWGYIVIAPRSGLDLFPDHDLYAEDVSHALKFLEDANADPASLLRGLVDTNRFGLSGHSMGGGADLLSAAMDDRIRAVAALAPAETWPSAIADMYLIEAPVFLIAGTDDAFAPILRHQLPMYENANAPRALAAIKGGSHCGFMDDPPPDAVCDTASVPSHTQLAITRRLLTAFFNHHLKGDQSAWTWIWGPALQYDRRLISVADPGIEMQPPAQSADAEPGQDAVFNVQVKNTGRDPDAYTLMAEGHTTGLAITPPVTPVLNPGESVTVQVRLAAPTRMREGITILSARSGNDGATRQFMVLQTR
ncbi:MAG: dienelactone hydrolase family protein [bacterium]